MRKQMILILILCIFLTACGSQKFNDDSPSSQTDTPDKPLSDIAYDALPNNGPSEYDYAPRGFTTPEGIPSHDFSKAGEITFKARIPFDGQYMFLVTAQGDDKAQLQIDSKQLGLEGENIPITGPDGEYGFWKLLDMSAGECTFTAKSLNDYKCSLLALARPVQRLDELPDTLKGPFPYTFLYTFSEPTTLNYTFTRELSNNSVYGAMAVFYNLADKQWKEIIEINDEDETEVSGSVQIPAGDIIICFQISNWNITFE